MKRFLAVVGVAVFLAACSDSNMTSPASQLRPGAASRDAGDPPPPPLSGSGDASLDLFGSDFAAPAAASTNSLPQCASSQFFNLAYTFSYLENKPGSNEVLRLDISGGGVTGDVTLHDHGNGKSKAQGTVSDGLFSFDIQSGDGTITPIFGGEPSHVVGANFDFSVTGTLTDLTTGAKCQASGSLSTESE